MYYDDSLEAEFLRTHVRVCCQRDLKGLYIFGRGGVGKSMLVKSTLTELLGEEQVGWIYQNGVGYSGGLYDLIAQHNGKTIFLDDMGNIFGQQRTKQVLLAAWEEGVNGVRPVSWLRKGKLETVMFSGRIICVSNNELVGDAVVAAMISRITMAEYNPSEEHVAYLIRAIAGLGYVSAETGDKMNKKECREVCEFVLEQCQKMELRNDCRDLTKSYSYYLDWRSGVSKIHWHDMVIRILQQRSAIAASSKLLHPIVPSQAEQKKSHLQIVERLLNDLPTNSERIPAFFAETGLSRTAWFDLVRQLKSLRKAG